MKAKPWWQIALPHEDIREGKLEEAVFAANLGDVAQDKGPIDYRDPETFFRKTYFTAGLTNLIGAVLSRLSGKGKGTSIQIQTPFGGGKTHALLALFHTFKHSDRVMHLDTIKGILEENKIRNIPETKVVVFAGEYADPQKDKTLWGEIAHQLGCYKLVEEHDRKRISPGKEIILELLSENKPVLILMDELFHYVVRAMGVPVEEGTLKGQVQTFLKSLTEAVSITDGCALITTLPSSVTERFEESEIAEKTFSELRKIFGRVEKIHTPVEGEEIYEIVRKRLFEDLGDLRDHKIAADEYFSLYQKLREDIPFECKEIAYREKIAKAYPFHPETIDILFERWGTYPTFQRTRGVLRLLAIVVGDIFKRESPAALIQPAHVNFAIPEIRREFVKHIGNEYEGIIASDVEGPGAKAPKIDREMGTEYEKFKVATGLATSIFFYSFSGGERKGITAQRLRLAFLREGIPPAIVGDALRRLEDELWYLRFEENLYYFSNVIGLNRVIVDREEGVKEDEIEEEIKRRIERMGGTDFKVFVWPRSSSDIPDNKELKLIILPYDSMVDDPKTGKFVRDIIDKYSTGFRTYKNTLMFLAVDPTEYKELRGFIKRFLAISAIKTDKDTMKRLTKQDKERVGKKITEADSSASSKILSVYRHLIKPSKDEIKTFNLGIPTVGEKLTFTKRTKDYLKYEDILLEKISPKVLFERTFSKEDERKSIAEVLEAFQKFPELPMLEGEQVIRNAIAQGVQDGMFGLRDKNKVHFHYYKEAISPARVEVSEEDFLVRKEIAQTMKEQAGVPVKEEKTTVTPIPKPAPGIIRRYALRASVPWDKPSDLFSGVLRPLGKEGAQISLEVKIDAQSKEGIKKDTLDRNVRETLKQIGAKILEEKEE